MTPGLPDVSGRDAVAAFKRLGYQFARQRGSHVRLRHPTDARRAPLSIPQHDSLKPGLLRRLLRDAHITLDEFLQLLRK